jgi:hypothetical protein
MLVLSACLTRRTEDVELTARDADSASGRDGGNDANNGGNDGSDNGNANGTTGGNKPKFCDDSDRCNTPELPYCDEDAKACATCRDGSDCAPFAGRKACVKNEGCFECNGEKAGECGSAKPLCDPNKHACVECTAEMTEGCTLQGKVCDVEAGACVECTVSANCTNPESAKCDSSTNTCGKCEANADCAQFAGKPNCEVNSGACVACLSNANCNDPAASHCDATTHQCTACANNTDCLHIADGADNLPLCLDAKCVECTRIDKAECGNTGVCNALTNRCADGVMMGTASMCDGCVSDEQCKTGQRCIQTTFNTGVPQIEGWFCQWVENAGAGTPASCSLVRPFVSPQTRGSLDGMGDAKMCTHTLASCGGYKAFRSACGRYDTGMGIIHVDDFADPDLPDDVEGKSETAAAITADDGVCGMAGKCVALNGANGAYRCSHGCINDSDCDLGATCSGTPKLCTVN